MAASRKSKKGGRRAPNSSGSSLKKADSSTGPLPTTLPVMVPTTAEFQFQFGRARTDFGKIAVRRSRVKSCSSTNAVAGSSYGACLRRSRARAPSPPPPALVISEFQFQFGVRDGRPRGQADGEVGEFSEAYQSEATTTFRASTKAVAADTESSVSISVSLLSTAATRQVASRMESTVSVSTTASGGVSYGASASYSTAGSGSGEATESGEPDDSSAAESTITK